MTLSEPRHDAHHDLTWLVGALARALFERAHDDRMVMAALQDVAACDFGAPPAATPPRRAAACRWLPEAAVAALDVAEEAAMALAASLRHLAWQALNTETGETADKVAMARVLGPCGPLTCCNAILSLLIAAPGSGSILPGHDRHISEEQEADVSAAVLFVLAGEAAFTDAHGALRHVAAGDVVALPGNARITAGGAPLLAAVLAGRGV